MPPVFPWGLVLFLTPFVQLVVSKACPHNQNFNFTAIPTRECPTDVSLHTEHCATWHSSLPTHKCKGYNYCRSDGECGTNEKIGNCCNELYCLSIYKVDTGYKPPSTSNNSNCKEKESGNWECNNLTIDILMFVICMNVATFLCLYQIAEIGLQNWCRRALANKSEGQVTKIWTTKESRTKENSYSNSFYNTTEIYTYTKYHFAFQYEAEGRVFTYKDWPTPWLAAKSKVGAKIQICWQKNDPKNCIPEEHIRRIYSSAILSSTNLAIVTSLGILGYGIHRYWVHVFRVILPNLRRCELLKWVFPLAFTILFNVFKFVWLNNNGGFFRAKEGGGVILESEQNTSEQQTESGGGRSKEGGFKNDKVAPV